MSQVAATVPIQGIGRELVQNLFVALRSAQLYDARNDTLRAAADRFVRTLEELLLVDRSARLEVGGDLILVNDVRIRSELRSYSIHANLLRFFRELGIGGFEWEKVPYVGEAARFVSVVGRLEAAEQVCTGCGRRMRAAGVDLLEWLAEADLPPAMQAAPLRSLGFRRGDVLTVAGAESAAHFQLGGIG